MVKGTDLGQDLDKDVEELKTMYGRDFTRDSGDFWNVLLDKAENKAYDKIKMVHKGDGVTAYGVLRRWFADLSGLGLAEQAKMVMLPRLPKKRGGVGRARGDVAAQDEEVDSAR